MDVTAGDLMTTRVFTLTPDMNLLEMDSVLFKNGISGAPVIDGQRLVGVASQVDIIRSVWEGNHETFQHASFYRNPQPMPISALEYISRDGPQTGTGLAELTVAEVMTRDPLVGHPEDSIMQIAERLVGDQIHRLPITDPDNGDLVGIVSSLDLVNAIVRYSLS